MDPIKKRVIYGVSAIIGLIFLFEYLIVLAFAKESLVHHEFIFLLLDPAVLVVVTAPFFYYLILQPLYKNVEELRLAKEAERRFLSNMSHEIRTPLNTIIGLLQVMPEKNFDAKQKQHLIAINQAAENLLALINDVLDFTKIEQGYLKIEPDFFLMRDLVSEIQNVFYPVISSKHVEFEVQNNLEEGVKILADKYRLKQIIYNLISNSLKFTNTGRISFQVIAKNKSDGKAGRMEVIFSVSDTGIGMSKEVCESLFSDFFQGDIQISKKYGGTGLGLAISKKLVELIGGTIRVVSQEDVGSKFILTLPVSFEMQAVNEQVQDSLMAKENLILKRKECKILVVEDNPINLEITHKMLAHAGYGVDTSTSGAEAIMRAKENNYDLILMDCQMPELDGFSTTQLLRKNGFSKPIFALTANAFKLDEKACYESGMNGFITKPIGLEKLIQTIDTALMF